MKRNPKRQPGEAYGVDSYRVAIVRACDKAFPPPGELARLMVKGQKGKRWETMKEWKARLGAKRWAELTAWWAAHRWHPHRLRHNAATKIRERYGAEAAKLAPGVVNMDVMEIYGERDAKLVERVHVRSGVESFNG